jgi:hypothetical protein
MLTDTWIIAQLLGEFCLLLLALVALFWSARIFFSWQRGSTSSLQIELEKRTYLVSAILEMLMLLQMLLVVIYLITLNEHLPPLLKGAMCAEGSLAANEYGKPLLSLKITSFLGAIFFYLLNRLDQKDPNSALTPHKYLLLFILLPLLILDFIISFLYYANLNPQVITTCCSIALFENKNNQAQFLEGFAFIDALLWAFYALLVLQVFFIVRLKKIAPHRAGVLAWFGINVAYMIIGIYSIENHFVKYIYGLPSHLCLYDMFLGHYYYVGYAIVSGFLFLLLPSLWLLLVYFLGKKIPYRVPYLRLQFWAALGALLSGLLPSLYEWLWQGNL